MSAKKNTMFVKIDTLQYERENGWWSELFSLMSETNHIRLDIEHANYLREIGLPAKEALAEIQR